MKSPSENRREKAEKRSRIGFRLVLSALTGSVWLFLLDLFRYAIESWPQFYVPTLALHGLSALCGLGLLLMHPRYPRLINACLTHPLVTLPALIGGLSFIHTLLTPFPLLPVLGAPETGQGAVWFLDLAVMIAAGGLLRRTRNGSRVVVLSAALALSGMVCVMLPPFRELGAHAMVIPDFLALPAVATAVIVIAFWPVVKKQKAWGILIGLTGVLLFSQNGTALLLFLTVMTVFRLIHWRWPRILNARAVPAWGMVIMPLAVTGLVYLVGTPERSLSLASRKEFQRLTGHALSEQPVRVWTGYGWGHMREFLIQYGTMNDRSVGGSGGKSRWEVLQHFWPYAMNILLESVLALGIAGPLLILVWLSQIPRGSPVRTGPHTILLMLAYAGIWAAWYHLPGFVPFLALAIGAHTGPRPKRRLRTPFFIMIPLALVIILEVLAAWLVFRNTRAYMGENSPNRAEARVSNTDCPSPFGRYDRGGYMLADLIIDANRAAVRDFKNKGVVSDAHTAWIKRCLCLSRQRLDSGPASIHLQVAYLRVFSRLALTFTDASWETERKKYLPEWRQRLSALFAAAPHRSDLAIPYLSWTLTQEDEEGPDRILLQIMDNNPRDPIGLWFSGLRMLQQGPATREEGFYRMNRALTNGIDRFLEIDSHIREVVEAQ